MPFFVVSPIFSLEKFSIIRAIVTNLTKFFVAVFTKNGNKFLGCMEKRTPYLLDRKEMLTYNRMHRNSIAICTLHGGFASGINAVHIIY